MPLYLIILITILVIVAIIAVIYVTLAARKVGIVFKKIDYLVEDLTLKSQAIKPVLDSLISLSSYVNTFDEIATDNFAKVVQIFNQSNDDVKMIVNDLKNALDKNKKWFIEANESKA